MINTPYDKIADSFHAVRTGFRAKEVEYLSLLLDGLPEGSTILDLGCGTGEPIATYLALLGHHVVGVDGSDAMLAFAREKLPNHRWIHDLIERVEFHETFAAVVCWDALFHLPRRHFEPVILKIHGWLATGGRLMVSSGGSSDVLGEGFTDTMFGHQFFYDSLPPGQMVAAVKKAGFDILLAEMCDQPDGGRNKGKWATIASRRA